ncbi:MAG: hypothetical protein AB8I08_25805 [Sandaracinaceae bacterium]
MRTFTLVIEPEGAAARRSAFGLAARGKDLLLVGASRAVLDLIASEIRVAHRVDVRVLATDPSDAGSSERILKWIDTTELPVDRVVSALADETDPVRLARVRQELTRLSAALSRREGARLVGGTLWSNQAEQDRPSSVRPPSMVPRGRASTTRGHGDPQ